MQKNCCKYSFRCAIQEPKSLSHVRKHCLKQEMTASSPAKRQPPSTSLLPENSVQESCPPPPKQGKGCWQNGDSSEQSFAHCQEAEYSTAALHRNTWVSLARAQTEVWTKGL